MKTSRAFAASWTSLALTLCVCLSIVACDWPVDPKPPYTPPATDVPGTPVNVYMAASGLDTALLWSAVTGADDYRIYVSDDDASYLVCATTSGTQYLLPKYGYYKVSARNEAGESTKSAAVYHERPAENVVATPSFTPAAGEFDAPQEIAIATATTGATIYYTTDGSTPSVGNSTVYTDSISVATGESVTITAIAALSGYSNSDAAVGTFRVHGWSIVGAAGFSGGAVIDVSLAIDASGNPCVAYSDASTTPAYMATAMKFTSPGWTALGEAGLSAGVAYYTSIAVDGAGSVYVAYEDGSQGGRGTVRKYGGSSWATLGSEGFSAGSFLYASLVICDSGSTHVPYVAFKDGGNGSRATVMKFDGSSWNAVGGAGFSAGTADDVSLAIASDGTPYVAFKDGGNGSKATVMKFDGSSWSAVGGAGISSGSVKYVSLAIAPDGTPYVAYQDGGTSDKATVMKYDGSWIAVGSAGFSPATADYVSLAIASDGTPYVAYRDGLASGKLTVMKFDTGSWSAVGGAGFTAGSALFVDLALDPDDHPYVSFSDSASGSGVTVEEYR